jgi:hypothetical protein
MQNAMAAIMSRLEKLEPSDAPTKPLLRRAFCKITDTINTNIYSLKLNKKKLKAYI